MVKTQGKQRSTPPSRRRYEASHPTDESRSETYLFEPHLTLFNQFLYVFLFVRHL